MEFEQIYTTYFRDVFLYVRRLSGNEHVAEEITSETFFRALRTIDKFRGDCDMRVWLCQIAKYTFYQYLDKKNRRKEVSMEEAIEVAAVQQLEKEYISNEQKVEIYKKIQQLESPMKDVLMLRLSGELSFREIGEILGKTENWARVTFYRGKQILGKELSGNE